MGGEVIPSDSTMDTVTLPIDCQGAGCSTESVFRTRDSGCFGPSPSVSNWSPATFSLSDLAAVAVAVRNASNGDTNGANNIWWCFERRALDPPSKSTSWQEDDTVIVSVSMPSETVRLDHHFNHIFGVRILRLAVLDHSEHSVHGNAVRQGIDSGRVREDQFEVLPLRDGQRTNGVHGVADRRERATRLLPGSGPQTTASS